MRQDRKKQPESADADRAGFFSVATRIAKNGGQLRRIREHFGLSRQEFAKRANISLDKVARYERPGPVVGNFWLFCNDLQSFFIDPRLIHDWDYLDGLLDPDPHDMLKGGSIGERDNWYQYSGPKFAKFRRWAHRKYIEKMSDDERKKPRSKQEIERWHKQWVAENRPDANEIIEAD